MTHGPNHLFCAGCSFDDDALTYAAWAGHFSAFGKSGEAEKWAKSAQEALGKKICSIGEIAVWVKGDGPCIEDIDAILETLKIVRDSYPRRSDKKARAAASPSPAIPAGAEVRT